MKSKEQCEADYQRREAERKAKYAERMGAIDERDAEFKAGQEATLEASRNRAWSPYYPSWPMILLGVVIPPYGIYQLIRVLVDQHKIQKMLEASR